jgi:hypothetical protein
LSLAQICYEKYEKSHPTIRLSPKELDAIQTVIPNRPCFKEKQLLELGPGGVLRYVRDKRQCSDHQCIGGHARDLIGSDGKMVPENYGFQMKEGHIIHSTCNGSKYHILPPVATINMYDLSFEFPPDSRNQPKEVPIHPALIPRVHQQPARQPRAPPLPLSELTVEERRDIARLTNPDWEIQIIMDDPNAGPIRDAAAFKEPTLSFEEFLKTKSGAYITNILLKLSVMKENDRRSAKEQERIAAEQTKLKEDRLKIQKRLAAARSARGQRTEAEKNAELARHTKVMDERQAAFQAMKQQKAADRKADRKADLEKARVAESAKAAKTAEEQVRVAAEQAEQAEQTKRKEVDEMMKMLELLVMIEEQNAQK